MTAARTPRPTERGPCAAAGKAARCPARRRVVRASVLKNAATTHAIGPSSPGHSGA